MALKIKNLMFWRSSNSKRKTGGNASTATTKKTVAPNTKTLKSVPSTAPKTVQKKKPATKESPKPKVPKTTTKKTSTTTKAKTPVAAVSTKPSRQRVLVLGASGYVGKATLAALTSPEHQKNIQAFAGVRNPAKFDDKLSGVTTIQADMNDSTGLSQTMKQGQYDSVFVVVPGHIDRTKLAIQAIDAAKAANVKFVLILSVTVAGDDTTAKSTIFGRQFRAIEDHATKLHSEDNSFNYAVIRLPLFTDNNWAHVSSIQASPSTFYDPRDPTKAHTPVSLVDVGRVAAQILHWPPMHYNKSYNVVGPSWTLNDMSTSFSTTLNKPVLHTRVTYANAKVAFMNMGFPEWQVDGIMELYKLIDEGHPIMNLTSTTKTSSNGGGGGDVEWITGTKPQGIDGWVSQNGGGFQ